jgi:hypothetical protein
MSAGTTCSCGSVHGCFHTAFSIGVVLSGLVIAPSTALLVKLILPSRKLKDNNGASTAAGSSGNGKDNMNKFPELTLSLPPMVVTISSPDGTLALLVVAGCKETAAGRPSSMVLFAVALAGVPCPNYLRFAVLPGATAVSFAAAGLTIAGLSGLLAAAIPPFGLHFSLIRGAMVFDVMFGLWL